ncbi:2-phospho-L-lactate transferase [Aquamicrobium sp. LC103]|uniref:2-phospho-L-lactate transferase n=1 Tax=Aquamicrobium sp. LC103 TaxID=1120658 RepID=UPI00063EAC87|nr:2-phospho-L-lactate transferase [Aquamicrobium sp. LC103]TKT74512.1 2-phospho-L-lactate transferase [Aquamicrobium sp. LC103]
MSRRVVALAGGVGGAKLVHGLANLLGENLSVIVNTGDDFEHVGLSICPDIDTVLYTLGGIANRVQGWGIEGESWSFLDQLGRLGGPDWFRLGDRDLAMHVLRTMGLARGERLTDIVARFAARLGIEAVILPMADEPVRTMVLSGDGELPFQDYFVRLRCEIPVSGFRLAGIEMASVTPEILTTMRHPDLDTILICPSNPFVSVEPILSVPGMRTELERVPVIAISPIIAGQAVKGPAAKMMRELDMPATAFAVAKRYAGLADGFVIDHADAEQAPAIEALGMKVLVTDALMRDEADRIRLARETLDFARSLRHG